MPLGSCEVGQARMPVWVRVQYMASQLLPHIVIAALVALNAIPRMTISGTEHWFTGSVPEPERFASGVFGQPTVSWVFGYPFTFYRKVGRPFTTKGGQQLFWPWPQQPSFRERLSLTAGAGDLALAVVIGSFVSRETRRYLLRRTSFGHSSHSCGQTATSP